MLSLAERIVIMAFIRDWYMYSSMGVTNKAAKELREKADVAQKVIDILNTERSWQGES